MTSRLKPLLAASALAFACSQGRAQTADDTAYMAKFSELNKQSLKLAREGDADGIEKLVPAFRQLSATPKVSQPCIEAAQAKIAMLEANVQFLHAEDGKDIPFLLEIQKNERVLNERRSACLGSKKNL